jgi:hypothetical protein
VVTVNAGQKVVVDGAFVARGLPEAPITLSGSQFGTSPFNAPTGTLELSDAIVAGRIHGGVGGTIIVTNSRFQGTGVVSSNGTSLSEDGRSKLIILDGCVFEPGGTVAIQDGLLVLRNSTFGSGGVSILRGYLFLDNVTLDGAPLAVTQEQPVQSLALDSLAVRNVSSGAGLQLNGGNFFIGRSVILEQNLYPLELQGGLVAGSTLPATGNVNNFIHVPLGGQSGFRGNLEWSDVQLPYVVQGAGFSGVGSRLKIAPNVTVQFRQDAGFSFPGTQMLLAHGLPDAPIRFEPFLPGQRWSGISFNANRNIPRLESVVMRGSRNGVVASDCRVFLQDSLVEDNDRGSSGAVFGAVRARKTQFLRNGVGVWTDGYVVSHGTADLDGTTNPNSFVGNGLAVEITNTSSTNPAQLNWWGDPSGPRAPQNPDGQGDPIGGVGASRVQIFPFRAEAPNFDDHPPVVRLEEPYFLARTGEKLILRWEASDDGAIVAQKVLFTPHGENPPFEVVAELPPGQRTYEFIVPEVPPSSNNNNSFVRILAVDDAGQEGWDDAQFFVPYTADWAATLTVTTDIHRIFRPGERVDVCWDRSGPSGTIDAWVLLDGDDTQVGLGGAHTGLRCLPIGMLAPFASTDSARLAVRFTYGAGGRVEYFFSDYFSIRPDPRVGDEPPSVEMTAPLAGEVFPAAEVVPIAWTASDDRGLQSFALQGSFDGGRTWHFIARELPPDARAFDWLLPPSDGIPDVRVRVIARDSRFQNSSSGADRVFSIGP